MDNINHVITPERMGLWMAVTFAVALLALVIALVGVHRFNDALYATQTEILLLNQKIDTLQSGTAAAAPAEENHE